MGFSAYLCVPNSLSQRAVFGALFEFLSSGCCLVEKSCLTLAVPWTVARQTSLSMVFPRQEYWSGLPLPFPGYLPDQGTNPHLPWQRDSLHLSHQGSPTWLLGMSQMIILCTLYTCVPFNRWYLIVPLWSESVSLSVVSDSLCHGL